MNTANQLIPKPYKGLIPYSEEDRLFFFGREREREIITEQLKAWNLTILYGDSGVGKSSVLRAGVAYNLSQAAKKNVDETGKPGWAIIVFPPIEGDLAGKVTWQDPLKRIEEQLKVEIAQLFEFTLTEIEEKFKQEIANLFKDAPSPPSNLSLVDKLKAYANIIR
ncbi:MAG: ATP-binding protein [Pleurocapsa sp. MO_226.B13]|nr:ATP-binding protein [Pleurocapsa sp. MO_226.B13]